MDLLAPPEWDLLLSAAMKNDATEIHRLIRDEGVNPSHANRVAQSALHIAALWGNFESVETLVEYKANVNAQNSMTGATPLHCAVQSGKGPLDRRTRAIEILIEKGGADVSLCDFFQKTPADYCDEDSQELAKLLQPKLPPLFQALEEGTLDEVLKLIKDGKEDASGNSIVHQKFKGQTPLWFTLDTLLADGEMEETLDSPDNPSKNKDCVKVVALLEILLEAGADPNAMPGGGTAQAPAEMMRNLEGPNYPPLYRVCLALQEAYKNKETEKAAFLETTVKLLKKYQARATPDLHQLLLTACRKNELDLAKVLIDTVHINPNVQGRQGMTPLQFAARSGRVEMVRYLLSLPNMDISIQDDQGKTAMDAAKVNNKEEIVDMLEDFENRQNA